MVLDGTPIGNVNRDCIGALCVTKELSDSMAIEAQCDDIEKCSVSVPLPGKDELFGLRLTERCGVLVETFNSLSKPGRSLSRWCFAKNVHLPRGLALRCLHSLPLFELRDFEVVNMALTDAQEPIEDTTVIDNNSSSTPLMVVNS